MHRRASESFDEQAAEMIGRVAKWCIGIGAVVMLLILYLFAR